MSKPYRVTETRLKQEEILRQHINDNQRLREYIGRFMLGMGMSLSAGFALLAFNKFLYESCSDESVDDIANFIDVSCDNLGRYQARSMQFHLSKIEPAGIQMIFQLYYSIECFVFYRMYFFTRNLTFTNILYSFKYPASYIDEQAQIIFNKTAFTENYTKFSKQDLFSQWGQFVKKYNEISFDRGLTYKDFSTAGTTLKRSTEFQPTKVFKNNYISVLAVVGMLLHFYPKQYNPMYIWLNKNSFSGDTRLVSNIELTRLIQEYTVNNIFLKRIYQVLTLAAISITSISLESVFFDIFNSAYLNTPMLLVMPAFFSVFLPTLHYAWQRFQQYQNASYLEQIIANLPTKLRNCSFKTEAHSNPDLRNCAITIKLSQENSQSKQVVRAYAEYLMQNGFTVERSRDTMIVRLENKINPNLISSVSLQDQLAELEKRWKAIKSCLSFLREKTGSSLCSETINNEGKLSIKIYFRIKSSSNLLSQLQFSNSVIPAIEKDNTNIDLFNVALSINDAPTPSDLQYLETLAKCYFQPKLDMWQTQESNSSRGKRYTKNNANDNPPEQSTPAPNRSVIRRFSGGLIYDSSDPNCKVKTLSSDHLPDHTFFVVLDRPANQLTKDVELQNKITTLMARASVAAAKGEQGFKLQNGRLKMKFLGNYGDRRLFSTFKENDDTGRAVLFHFNTPAVSH